jgi:xylulokinase
VGGAQSLLRLTCNPALTGFTAPKILWMRRHHPEVIRKTAKVVLPKDYVRYRLTGGYASDVSDSSGTLLFDIRGRRWSQPVLKALRIPREWMPEALEGPEITGQISAEAARATGLLAGTPVMAGGGDQAAGAIGCGVIRPGVVSAALGTSGVVFAACKLPRATPNGRLHLFCSAVTGGWHLMGVMLSAGGSLQWLRNELGGAVIPRHGHGGEAYDRMCAAAAKIPAGAEGLTFLPYLTGERTPHADPHARGVFFGLSLKHTAAHLTRAVLEGVAYGMRDSVELMRDLGVNVTRVRLSGGGARNPLWCGIQAAVYEATGARLTREEGPAMGAAMLAGIGAKVFRDYDHAVKTCVVERDAFRPDPKLVQTYRRGFGIYRSLYPALKPIFQSAA